MPQLSVAKPVAGVGRPQPGEYNPYYDKYIALIQGGDVLATLEAERRETLLLLSGRDNSDGDIRYAPDKWSAKEVLGHVCDAERIFAYRALCIARGETMSLPGFD